ncbi:diguanylate cyclase [uncultured Paraglaciecola sp.]|uniref:sensor domain-containing diguanylate cyclase n=1 Tax=uncultured Paraglaciecola sp. TaxID=1765024 RepID=UPI0030DB5097|tara:strand:- start:9555 stop:11462 length:1908 start_codon:yes stop_codon:yes gene_type:complete
MGNSSFKHVLNNDWLLFVFIMGILGTAAIFVTTSVFDPLRPSNTQVQNISHLVDPESELSITDILNLPNNSWQQYNQNLASLEMSNDLHWFKFTLNNVTPTNARLVEIDYPLLDKVKLWFVQHNKVLSQYTIGDTLVFPERIVEHENFIFPVPISEYPVDVYISVYTKGAMRIPLNVWQQQDYLAYTSKNSLVMGGFFGLMLAMGLSNLFFFITTRSPIFLIYSGYVICIALTLSAIQGLGYRYIWPNYPWLQQHAVGIFANLTVWLSIIFCLGLLNVKAFNNKLSTLLRIIAAVFLLGVIFSLFVPLPVFLKTFLVILCVSELVILAVVIGLWIKGLKVAGYYTLASAVLFCSGFAVSLDALNLVNFSLPSYYLLMLGAGIETLLLALILAISHNEQRQALINTQAELLNKERQAQHAQKDLLLLQESATEELEYKVQERTLELEIALRELSETNRELKEKNTLDALTGIRNRSYFDKKYQAEVRRSRREQTQLSIVMMDIDHFKKVNDQYGHLVGDECIKSVARTLEKALKRPSDDVCRYGGEEFALILPSTDLEGAMILVEQLRSEIEKTTIQAEDESVNLTISAGIGTAIAELNQPEDSILALADKQLYNAKNAGRNNVQGSQLNVIQHQD